MTVVAFNWVEMVFPVGMAFKTGASERFVTVRCMTAHTISVVIIM